MMRSEEAIRLDVIDQLKWDSRVDISDLDVEVSGGTVKLKGTVPSYRSRETAGMDALNVKGVTYLVNELTVRYGANKVIPTDDQIKANIEKVISWDPDIAMEKICISVQSAKVILEGSVNTLWKKLKAEDLLSNMTGIVDIINKLVVVPTETRIDQAISEEIIASLERNIHGELKDVNVQVEDQVVTLTGKVPSWEIYHLVRDIVRYTSGVIDVQNMLLVDLS
jgi:osmotically-inducible protein OsmY